MPTPTSNGIVSPVALSGANAIDSLLCGNKWGGARGTGIALTYSFSQSTSVYRLNYGIGEPKSGLSAFTDIQKNATRNALQAWSDVANVQFAEVVDSADSVGDLRFARSFVRTAQAYCPVAFPEAGDAWFSNFDSAFDTDQKGTYGYETFLHEIGHTLGLKHPHEAGKGGVANAEIDVIAYTLMSYRSYVGAPPSLDPTESFYPTTPMLDDIAAVQYLYGANWNTRSGDSVYTWSPGQQILETIWDGGGTDTIDWSNQSSAAKINLNQGQWSELGPSYWNGVANESRTLAIAGEVTIENATGGSGNDNIIGNDGNNILNGGAGSDVMQGQEGDDRYVVDQPGDKVIEDPRAGNDTVEAAISYTLGSHLESLTLSGTAQINGKGNKFNNTITGNAMSNGL
ncbi:MAG TPA: M10 family metallopeptidase C-terminal domain-containing protein, partial [Candidatus Caenarcaniphilales bacterium]